MSPYKFQLYVSGQTPRSLRAEVNLRRICEQFLGPEGIGYTLELIDVLERPDLAEAARIFVTPATHRVAPLPIVRVVGDLSDPTKVLNALGLDAPSSPFPLSSPKG